MGNLGFSEIMIIMVVVLLVFGAKRLPEVGSSIGKGIREFKRSLTDADEAIRGGDERHQVPGGRPYERPYDRDHVHDAPPAPPSGGEPKRLSQ